MKTIRETLDQIGAPVPANLVSRLKEKGGAEYIAWADRADLMDERSPGWSKRIVTVGQMPALRGAKDHRDEAMLTYCIVEIEVPCLDGTLIRQATGTDDDPEGQRGTPLDRAEASAFGRATSQFGLGRELYGGVGAQVRHQRIAARAQARAAAAAPGQPDPSPPPGVDPSTGEVTGDGAPDPAPIPPTPPPEAPGAAESAAPAGSTEVPPPASAPQAPGKAPARKANRGQRADWEPDSWNEEIAALESELALADLVALEKQTRVIGPDDPTKPPDHQTYKRRNNVIMLAQAAIVRCVLAAEASPPPGWSWDAAHDAVIGVPVGTPGRPQALGLCRKLKPKRPAREYQRQGRGGQQRQPAAVGAGTLPDDWPAGTEPPPY